jgi:hypothetical protein
MSSASSLYDDTPPAGSYQKWRQIIASEPRVLEYQQRMLRRPVSHSYDMPFVAGYNTKGTQIYIDRHLPFLMEVGKEVVCIRDFICLHEATEKALLALWMRDYESAHHIATSVEYHGVTEAGVSTDDYRRKLRPFIKADAHEKLEKIPADLDLAPFRGKPINKKLIDHLRVLMEKDRRSANRIFRPSDEEEDKVTKSSVRYENISKHPGQQCKNCSMFVRPNSCTHVYGDIKSQGWCKDWAEG